MATQTFVALASSQGLKALQVRLNAARRVLDSELTRTPTARESMVSWLCTGISNRLGKGVINDRRA